MTGATNGIGLVAARELAQQGAHVVLVGRDPARTQAAVDSIRRDTGSAHVESMLCDFASQRSVRALARDFLARHERLDVLVNNAGAVHPRREVTEDGLERTFAVNHLGPFLLTTLLLDRMVQSAPARIVNVASRAHTRVGLDLDDLQAERGRYVDYFVYARSKLANVLFTRELARRLEGTGVTANCLHPGVVATGIWASQEGLRKWAVRLASRFFVSPEQGARTIVQLATAPELEGVSGRYFSDGREVAPSRIAQDDQLARALWERSEALVRSSA